MIPPASTIRAVAFDLDGTTLNTEDLYQIVLSELMGRRGKDFCSDLRNAMMGKPSPISYQIMVDWHGLQDTIETLSQETREIFLPLLDSQLALMPGVSELIAALELGGLPRAVATSSRRRFVEDTLGRLGMLPRFAFVLTADDVENGKPHPEIYLRAAKQFDIQPHEMLVLEDSATGCASAVSAGAYVVAVPGEHSRRQDFAGAAFIADTMRDPRIYHALGL